MKKFVLICAITFVTAIAAYELIRGEDVNDLFLKAVAHKQGKDVMANLIARGADVNAVGDMGMTPLMWAVWKSNARTVRDLLDMGADMTIKSHDGLTALDYARQRRNFRAVAILEERQAVTVEGP